MSPAFIAVSVVFWAAVAFGAYKLFGKAIKARAQAEADKLQAKVEAKVADVNDKIAGK